MRKPDILYIMSDQHAARCLGVEGDRAALTPNIDRLAQEGIRFGRAYCPSPVCLPSRMSILTAQHPYQQECWTNNDILASDRPTWAHALGASGYHTVLCGRMHALGPDQRHGFAERPLGDHSPNWPGVERISLGELAGTSGPNAVSIEKSGAGATSYDQLDEDVTQTAVSMIEDLTQREDGRPFCLAVGYMLPHPPYVARPEDYAAVAELVGPPQNATPPDHPWLCDWRAAKSLDHADKADIARARTAYYGMIRRLDLNIGRLLAALNRSPRGRNAIIVYLSDHGDHIGEHGLFWKHTFYEQSIRVPLILRRPGERDTGRVIDVPVSVAALGPTLLDLVGAEQLPNASIASLLPMIETPATPKAAPVFVEYCTDGTSNWEAGPAVQQRGVILDGYKYVYYHGFPDQMFDLKNDPGETVNLVGKPGHAKMAERLRQMVLDGWDPEQVAEQISRKLADKRLLRKWAEEVQPDNILRWLPDPGQNSLIPAHRKAAS